MQAAAPEAICTGLALTSMVWCAELQSQNETMNAGDRLMDISAQGQAVLTSFDVYEEAGKLCTVQRDGDWVLSFSRARSTPAAVSA